MGWENKDDAFWKEMTPQKVLECIENGDCVDARHDILNITPLHLAAMWNNDPKVITALLSKGAEVNAKDEDAKITPLHLAAEHNQNPEIIQALVDAGADLKAEEALEIRTPLHVALQCNSSSDVMIVLLDATKKVIDMSLEGDSLIKSLNMNEYFSDIYDNDNNVYENDPDAVKIVKALKDAVKKK